MFAILDIESTGGKFNEEGITEIAIYKFDGEEIVDQFSSLINPERKIQAFVVGLTGINQEMLRTAPKFYQVAKRIIEITEDCILIAHNAKFDYRILRTEFKRLGYDYKRKSICTVELSKKLLPDEASYSLGKLTRSLGIPVSKRHRAAGDAKATVELFKLLLQKDSQKNIIAESQRLHPVKSKDKKLIRLIEEIPAKTGVYYFFNEAGEVIYIGKSKNMKKRANQHFTNDSHKSKQIQKEVSSVNYEITGNEVLALLKENEEIKDIQPKYNRALKKRNFTHALFETVNSKGYIEFKIGSAQSKETPITTFTNLQQAKNTMSRYVEEFELCQKLSGLHKTKGACFNYTIKACHGACVQEESSEVYNQRAKSLIEQLSFQRKSFLVVDQGRKTGEKSIILIENGAFKGFGYVALNHQLKELKRIKSIITHMDDNPNARHIVSSYLKRKNNRFKIQELPK